MKLLQGWFNKRANIRTLEFLELLVQLEPVEALGVSKALKVSFMDPKKEIPKDLTLDTILSETIDGFVKASRKTQRDIMKIMRASLK